MVCGREGLSGICIGGRTFGWLGIQGQTDGSSVRNIYEALFNEEGMRAGKAVFEGVFNFAASEYNDNFDSTDSSFQIEEERSALPYTQ